MKKPFLIIVGWLAVGLGIIGVVLPILPTTPFLILAAACFAKSSPRFHKMLLTNRWFGPTLTAWEKDKVVTRSTKYKASLTILITFSISVYMLNGKPYLQAMLVGLGLVGLVVMWRLKEAPQRAALE